MYVSARFHEYINMIYPLWVYDTILPGCTTRSLILSVTQSIFQCSSVSTDHGEYKIIVHVLAMLCLIYLFIILRLICDCRIFTTLSKCISKWYDRYVIIAYRPRYSKQ